MAKEKKAKKVSVRHNGRAPCAQGFNIRGKPGKKVRSWWNGYRASAPRPEAD